MIYLDNAAGTRPYPDVISTITDVLTHHWGNASASHSIGKDAMNLIDKVTQNIADDINCTSDELIWTSGACEANSLAIMGVLRLHPHMHFITSYLEHTSIVEAVKNIPGNPVFFVKNDMLGNISLINLENILKNSYQSGVKTLISISFANSEIGVIQDVQAISTIVHKYNGLLHVDATQMYPWCSIDVQNLGIDMMSVSGQKMHCVKGVGFLYVRNGIKLKPLIYGSQQDGRRGGTYPTHLIAAFGKALEITRAHSNYLAGVKMLRDHLVTRLLTLGGIMLNGPGIDSTRLPNNISLTIEGVNAETLVTMCDLMGVAIAKGSACKSYEPTPNKALLAIGLTTEEALNTVRISLDSFNSLKEINQAADIIMALIENIRFNNEI